MGHLDAVTAYFDLLSETFAIAGGLAGDGDDGEVYNVFCLLFRFDLI